MWKVTYTKQALASFEKLGKSVRVRMYDKLNWLAENFADISPEPLSGDRAGSYKLRVGDYRVIYEYFQSDERIRVLEAGHRSEVYED
jgi:mRNA interferase RelE/StbE